MKTVLHKPYIKEWTQERNENFQSQRKFIGITVQISLILVGHVPNENSPQIKYPTRRIHFPHYVGRVTTNMIRTILRVDTLNFFNGDNDFIDKGN